MKKLKLLSLFAAMLFAMSMWAADPIGCVDAWQGNDGSIYIKGWAFDSENKNAALAIHVYMYKAGVADPVWSEGNTVANSYRPDVHNVHNCGNNHGFERYISTVGVTPGTYWINIYAIHAAGTSGTNVRLQQAGTSDQYDFTITVKSPLTISYDANGGSNAPSSQQKCYGININLQSKGSLARTGYTTDGWATSSTGGKAYDFGASYSGNSSTKLYAHWTANKYTVTFDKQGGNGGSNNCTATYNSAMPTISIPGRTGYNFGGYYTAQNGGGTQYIKPEGTSTRNWNITSNTTLYAKWTAKTYTVTFDQQGGTGGSASVTATYDANMPSATMPTRAGYTFKGYYDATSGGTLYYNANGSSARTWNKANAATLYARWEIINYTIAYNLDGGEVAATNPTEYTIETETFTLNNPTKKGYTFAGWTGSNGEEPQIEVTIAKGSTENKSYTAHWTALKPCELSWMNVPEGGVVGTIGHEDEIVLPQVNASLDFISAFQAHTATLRLGSTDESVLAVYGFNNFAVNGVGECDVYVVHDEDAVFAYDSAAFHVTVNPEPTYLDADFAINFMSDSYTVAEGTLPAGTVIDGTPNTGQTAHGYQNVVATVPVKAGKYRLTLGTCQYGTGTGNVMSETNIELASFDQKTAACYHQNPAQNTVSVIFDVDQDQHITIDCGQYTPYMKLEAVTAYQVSFALSDAEGTAPAAVDVTVGEDITMPVNKTMYKEGYTLTGWSDGVNTYAIGNSFTPANDVVLTPVFTANEADLLNASSEVTVKWYFGGDNGAPTTSYEGTSGLLVAQATIGDKTVDVKLSIDATSGKFAPQATTEWANVQVGTIFTYPYKAGMTVNVGNYKSKVTYYIADAEGKVVCYYENDYYSFIQVTYPASTPGPATAIDNTAVDTKAVKRIANGQLLIERDGKTYNAQGAVVR